jgi:hypothetical protein
MVLGVVWGEEMKVVDEKREVAAVAQSSQNSK